ncbi:hypothetical protein SDC9_182017 [bioreactor metagenome]|uniref:Uncharacterized protein n=1 Tax=bioreactor metagenome TaxID=1076179 RepID=A0A645HFS7_9ZZZZ
MNICICIGSSCHLKGSYSVKQIFESLVKENNLEDKVKIQVAFCLGHCRDGVSIKIDENLITGVSRENAKDVFTKYILEGVGHEHPSI